MSINVLLCLSKNNRPLSFKKYPVSVLLTSIYVALLKYRCRILPNLVQILSYFISALKVGGLMIGISFKFILTF